MKIIIDNKIPYIKEAVQRIADEVVYAPGKDLPYYKIGRAHV